MLTQRWRFCVLTLGNTISIYRPSYKKRTSGHDPGGTLLDKNYIWFVSDKDCRRRADSQITNLTLRSLSSPPPKSSSSLLSLPQIISAKRRSSSSPPMTVLFRLFLSILSSANLNCGFAMQTKVGNSESVDSDSMS